MQLFTSAVALLSMVMAITLLTVAANKHCGDPLCWKKVGNASYCKDYQQNPAGRVCHTLDPKDTRMIPCECPKPTPTTTTTTQSPTPHRPCQGGDSFCDMATGGGVCERFPSKEHGNAMGVHSALHVGKLVIHHYSTFHITNNNEKVFLQ
ncbi:hypothetical protein Pmar_PMAR023817 [Perkinsus marinus ATCC 50983]|uniref:Uncharacterized protein n=1 Tax=Perkinsus marinus (strain ATCC 50983 / TXsc) TaxID=423536 RepID=C5KYK8_PERM5|nr:hypothetical protein Pmar_PMAR023817 [Perkinsus marinus ATCC 50983]EER10443.1 hypothetical protein Pmar_PMAR023817 [Perkinsus marinus ATCC 50983]|eukprot:XP_002778648.1 hypothetical protein Pmar_PMAR023817 [Perkinsus marinus ATCC 50983]